MTDARDKTAADNALLEKRPVGIDQLKSQGRPRKLFGAAFWLVASATAVAVTWQYLENRALRQQLAEAQKELKQLRSPEQLGSRLEKIEAALSKLQSQLEGLSKPIARQGPNTNQVSPAASQPTPAPSP